jgi:hypothetical protein
LFDSGEPFGFLPAMNRKTLSQVMAELGRSRSGKKISAAMVNLKRANRARAKARRELNQATPAPLATNAGAGHGR